MYFTPYPGNIFVLYTLVFDSRTFDVRVGAVMMWSITKYNDRLLPEGLLESRSQAAREPVHEHVVVDCVMMVFSDGFDCRKKTLL